MASKNQSHLLRPPPPLPQTYCCCFFVENRLLKWNPNIIHWSSDETITATMSTAWRPYATPRTFHHTYSNRAIHSRPSIQFHARSPFIEAFTSHANFVLFFLLTQIRYYTRLFPIWSSGPSPSLCSSSSSCERDRVPLVLSTSMESKSSSFPFLPFRSRSPNIQIR